MGCANTIYLFIHLLPARGHCLNGREESARGKFSSFWQDSQRTSHADPAPFVPKSKRLLCCAGHHREFKGQYLHRQHHSFNSHVLSTSYRTVATLRARVTAVSKKSVLFPPLIGVMVHYCLGSACPDHHHLHDYCLSSLLRAMVESSVLRKCLRYKYIYTYIFKKLKMEK